MVRVSDIHSDSHRFDSCMQTRHLEKGTDSKLICTEFLAHVCQKYKQMCLENQAEKH